MEQRYNSGFTNGVYCKIIRPIKLAEGSTETIISPSSLEEKTLLVAGNYDSAPRMYGSLFFPQEEGTKTCLNNYFYETGLSCDPDQWAPDEVRAPSIFDRVVSYIKNKIKRPEYKPEYKNDEEQAPSSERTLGKGRSN